MDNNKKNISIIVMIFIPFVLIGKAFRWLGAALGLVQKPKKPTVVPPVPADTVLPVPDAPVPADSVLSIPLISGIIEKPTDPPSAADAPAVLSAQPTPQQQPAVLSAQPMPPISLVEDPAIRLKFSKEESATIYESAAMDESALEASAAMDMDKSDSEAHDPPEAELDY